MRKLGAESLLVVHALVVLHAPVVVAVRGHRVSRDQVGVLGDTVTSGHEVLGLGPGQSREISVRFRLVWFHIRSGLGLRVSIGVFLLLVRSHVKIFI